jgi:acyl carrier protein
VSLEQKVLQDVLRLIDDVLGLGGRSQSFTSDTPLLGALPELDSMAVVGLLTALEERFGFFIADDEIDGNVFATVGTFTRFVQDKLGD